jgi:hypothetical protein
MLVYRKASFSTAMLMIFSFFPRHAGRKREGEKEVMLYVVTCLSYPS